MYAHRSISLAVTSKLGLNGGTRVLQLQWPGATIVSYNLSLSLGSLPKGRFRHRFLHVVRHGEIAKYEYMKQLCQKSHKILHFSKEVVKKY